MRTQDNLEENVSSFYAELQRISQLLELIPESKVPVFFMLDELLKGTNSQDRHKGAMALVTQLHEMNITGMVSTHDLELAILEQNLQKVENYSFESYLHEGELKFDYKIHKGITESFNASILMQKMGIEVDKYSGDKKGSS
jgi:DNA mismatch repair ATPase MutS